MAGRKPNTYHHRFVKIFEEDDRGLTPCTYCGVIAQCWDHTTPYAHADTLVAFGWPRTKLVLVPACSECNALLSDALFTTLGGRRRYLKERLRYRYRKVLEYINWTERELEDLGPNLRSSVIGGLREREWVKERLAWPRQLKRKRKLNVRTVGPNSISKDGGKNSVPQDAEQNGTLNSGLKP